MLDTEMSSACMQGGSVRTFIPNYQAGNLHPQSPHAAWQFAHHPTRRILDDEKNNDSGVQSAVSDSHSSESDHGDASQSPKYQENSQQQRAFYSMLAKNHHHPYTGRSSNGGGFSNPLTPPNSEPLVSPKSEEKEDITLTPCSSPKVEPGDPLRQLEMSVEKSVGGSSKASEAGSAEDEADEDNLSIPRVNSHGKLKTFKCKQCSFVTYTKTEFWSHSKVHIKADKVLSCPTCPFVTEYKHHLEYHLLNHAGAKPHKCNQCDYSCVNKSMLNSHMKSHSNVYRYRCYDCSYATKYCHSLKIHLRKYNHKPAVVLDPDGTPRPDMIIDVHGTRRGPKNKNGTESPQQPPPAKLPAGMETLLPQPLHQLSAVYHQFLNNLPNPQLFQNLQQAIQERQNLIASLVGPQDLTRRGESTEHFENQENHQDVLDLRKTPTTPETVRMHKRKGPAFKVDISSPQTDEEDDEETTTMFSNVEAVVQNEDIKTEMMETPSSGFNNNNQNEEKACQHCNIWFADDVLYTMHMGYHGFKNPFSCNMCGQECGDKVAFFLHIARVPHP